MATDPKEWGYHILEEVKRINSWIVDLDGKVDQITVDIALLKQKSNPKLPPILYGGSAAVIVTIVLKLLLNAVGQHELADAIPSSN